MKILVTGARGFVGRNLCAQLNNIREGKAGCYGDLKVSEVYEYDLDSTPEQLDAWCRDCDFVFNLAGVNRPKDNVEFMKGNYGFASTLLDTLRKYGNTCPVMLSSSVQASLSGRFANDLPIQVNDPSVELELLYIDDLVDEMISALIGKEHRCRYDGIGAIADENGMYCYCPVTHHVRLGEIVNLLETFRQQPSTLVMPEIPEGSFAKKLYSTYLSYLPKEKAIFPLKMNTDQRGSFTELLKTKNCGQFSVNISRPGITKGQHWHNSKWELFIVVSGRALIQQRRIGSDEVLNFEVSGERIEAVHMLPGYTHNIINLSETDDLVTLMWASEAFNPDSPDTYFLPVE